MKTLEEIKNEVAKECKWDNWDEVYKMDGITNYMVHEVAKRYATEAIKADRERIKAGHTKDLHPALFSDLAIELNKDIDNPRIILP